MRKNWKIAVVLILVVHCWNSFVYGSEKEEVLFPDREYVKKVSELFFKKIDLTLPEVAKVDFFARSQAYPSAYLALSPIVAKNPYFKALLEQFVTTNPSGIEAFKEYKGSIILDNYAQYFDKLNVSPFTFYLLIIHTLITDFQDNRLSGEVSFRLWNVALALTESAYTGKDKKVAENAALLRVASRLTFFKAAKKWQKKALNGLKKIKPETITDKDIRFVFGW